MADMTGSHDFTAPRSLAPLIAFGDSTPPVRRVPIALARRFAQICTTVSAASVAEADLTPLEWAAIVYVKGEPGLDQTRLAGRIGIDRNNTSILVERLESRGLIERRVNGEDRRARLLYLSSRGVKLFERLYPRAAADQHGILAVLDPADRELFLDLLLRVIEGNRSLARPGTGRRKRNSRKAATKE
jgi:DNA-binding MarR family transcriptional regulator